MRGRNGQDRSLQTGKRKIRKGKVDVDIAQQDPRQNKIGTRDQINWLNAYHAHVYEMLSPRLTEEEKTWLKAKTAPIDR